MQSNHVPKIFGCWGCEECMPGCEHGEAIGYECICYCEGCIAGRCIRAAVVRMEPEWSDENRI